MFTATLFDRFWLPNSKESGVVVTRNSRLMTLSRPLPAPDDVVGLVIQLGCEAGEKGRAAGMLPDFEIVLQRIGGVGVGRWNCAVETIVVMVHRRIFEPVG